MKELKFKTNINCSGCVAKVTPALNNTQGICHWDVDTSNKDKVLTIHSDQVDANEIIKTVQQSGFSIEPIQQ